MTTNCPHCQAEVKEYWTYGGILFKCESVIQPESEIEVSKLCKTRAELNKANQTIQDHVDTLAAVYAKLGLTEENTDPKMLVSDTILEAFNKANEEIRRLKEERDAYAKQLQHIADATPEKWEMGWRQFADKFRPWAQNVARFCLENTAAKAKEALG